MQQASRSKTSIIVIKFSSYYTQFQYNVVKSFTPLESLIARYSSKPRWTISAEWLVVFRLATTVSRIMRSRTSSRSPFSSPVAFFASATVQSAGRPVADSVRVRVQPPTPRPVAHSVVFFVAVLKLSLTCWPHDCQTPDNKPVIDLSKIKR